jgi:hypothetical protein
MKGSSERGIQEVIETNVLTIIRRGSAKRKASTAELGLPVSAP